MNPQDFKSSTAGKVIRTQIGYWAFIPNTLPPSIQWSPSLVSLVGTAERSLGKVDSYADTLPSPHILIRPLIRREAVLSSRIEGTKATFNDLLIYETGQLSYLEPETDVQEVHNYVEALDYGLNRLSSLPVSLQLIRELHGKLMEGMRGDHLTPGKFRRSQNWIGSPGSSIESARFVPPPVDEMITALNALEEYMHKINEIPPLVRIALIHYQFEAIHPFLDGNGRMGRLLVSLLMCNWGLLSKPWLYLSEFFETHRSSYYDCLLAVSQGGDWESWLSFFLKGVANQSQDSTSKLKELQLLIEAYQDRISGERAAKRLVQASYVLFERPILNIRQLEKAMGVSYRSAQRYIEKLEQLGILTEITGRRRNRIYQADEILAVLILSSSGS